MSPRPQRAKARAILDAMRCEANTLAMCLDGALTYSVVGDKCLAFCQGQCHSEGNIFMTTYCFPYATFYIPVLLVVFLCTIIRLVNGILNAIFCGACEKSQSSQMR